MADFNLEGLLGSAFGGGGGNALDEYLTPEQRAAMQRNAMLAASAALLKAGGESTRRIGIGEALGGAFEAGQAGYEKAQTGALTQMAMKQKMEEAKKAAELRKMISGVFAPQAAMPGAAPMPEVDTGVPPLPTAGAAMPPAQGMPAPMNANIAKANQYRQVAKMLEDDGQLEKAMQYQKFAMDLDPPTTATGTALSKLIAERAMLPVGSPLFKAYDAAIEKESQFAPPAPRAGTLLSQLQADLAGATDPEIRSQIKARIQKEINNAPPPQNIVNVGGQILETTEQKGKGDLNIKMFGDASTAAGLAQKTLPSLEIQSQILNKGFTTGFGTDAQKAGASVLAALGVPEANKFATDAQSFLAATQQAVLQKQLEQKGPQTEADSKRVTQTGAQLGNTVDANRFIIDVAKEQLKRDIERKKFLESWWKTNKTLEGADDAWYSGAGGQSLFDSPGLKKYVASTAANQIPTGAPKLSPAEQTELDNLRQRFKR
jgi:hypothetical protein